MPGIAEQPIAAVSTNDGVVAPPAVYPVSPGTAADEVVATITGYPVVSPASLDDIVASAWGQAVNGVSVRASARGGLHPRVAPTV